MGNVATRTDGRSRRVGARTGSRVVALVVALALSWPTAATADRLVVPGGPTFTSVGDEAVAFNGFVYFAADNGVVGNELWRTNGTAAGTSLVEDFDTVGPNVDGDPSGFRVVGNRLYFNVGSNDLGGGSLVVFYIEGDNPPVRTQLPSTDAGNGHLIGSVGGTVLLRQLENGNGNYGLYALGQSGSTFADIDAGTDNVSSEPAGTMGGFAYFTKAPVGPNGGAELYRTDGATVTLVKDIDVTAPAAGSSPFDFVATGNRVYFEADDGVHGTELWVTDGTGPGTQLVKEHRPGTAGTSISPTSVAVGNTLFYVPNDPATGAEPWRTNGTLAGTAVVKDIVPGTGANFGASTLFAFGSRALFVRGSDVFVSNGTPAGTVKVATVDADGLAARFLAVSGSRAYFRGGSDPVKGAVWRTDGTVAGTDVLTAGGFSSAGTLDARPMTVLGTKLVFFGNVPGSTPAKRRVLVIDTTLPDLPKSLTVLKKPGIKGKAVVGKKLKVRKPVFEQVGVRLTYQWFANGKAIKKATKSSLKLKNAHKGKKLTLKVTATKSGHRTVVLKAGPTKKVEPAPR